MRANGDGKRMLRSDINRGQRADWSPGGRSWCTDPMALNIVRTDGTLERQIATRGSDPVWSPNGRWIAYRTGSAHRARFQGWQHYPHSEAILGRKGGLVSMGSSGSHFRSSD